MRVMKLIFVVSLIIFFVTFAVTSKTDCDICDFDVEELVNDYHDTCIDIVPTYNKTLTLLNNTFSWDPEND